MPPAHENGEQVQSFARGLRVIKAFTGFPLTLSEVAERTGLAPAAARRYLVTLTELGYLAQEGSLFTARAKLLELAQPYLDSNETVRKAEPVLRQLCDTVNETATLTQFSQGEVINVLAVQTTQELAIQVNTARRLPAYCTAMGRAMLSLLPEDQARDIIDSSTRIALTPHTLTNPEQILEQVRLARQQGYCFAEEEHTLGIRTMSVPVQLPQGPLVALSAPTPTAREDRQTYLHRVAEPLRQAAARMAAQ